MGGEESAETPQGDVAVRLRGGFISCHIAEHHLVVRKSLDGRNDSSAMVVEKMAAMFLVSTHHAKDIATQQCISVSSIRP